MNNKEKRVKTMTDKILTFCNLENEDAAIVADAIYYAAYGPIENPDIDFSNFKKFLKKLKDILDTFNLDEIDFVFPFYKVPTENCKLYVYDHEDCDYWEYNLIKLYRKYVKYRENGVTHPIKKIAKKIRKDCEE